MWRDKRWDEMLTAVEIKNAKPGFHSDGMGLYLLVKESGAKSWIYRFQIKGRRREMGLGSLNDVSTKEARAKAAEARALHLSGIDPINARMKSPSAELKKFESLAIDYIEDHKASWKNKKHVQQWKNTLSTYAYPKIGNVEPADITVENILTVLKPIWHTKTETASRLRGRLEKILDSAKVKGYRSGENPAAWRGNLEHVLPHPDKISPVTHHPALPYTQVAEFLERLTGCEGTGALCLEFTILSACRSGETRLATWDEFDFENKVWTIPASRMKMKREHRVPLSPEMLEVLERARGYQTNNWVFPSTRKGVALSDMALTQIVRRLHPECTVHGFRSSFRDWGAEETEFANEALELCLAHQVASSVEKAYSRGDMLERRREVMDAWGKYCFPAD